MVGHGPIFDKGLSVRLLGPFLSPERSAKDPSELVSRGGHGAPEAQGRHFFPLWVAKRSW